MKCLSSRLHCPFSPRPRDPEPAQGGADDFSEYSLSEFPLNKNKEGRWWVLKDKVEPGRRGWDGESSVVTAAGAQAAI